MNPPGRVTLSSFRAPLLWIFIPWCAGFVLASYGVSSTHRFGIWLLALSAALSGLAQLCFPCLFARVPIGLWRSCLFVSAVATAMLFWWAATQPDSVDESWAGLPPREMTLKLEIDSISKAHYFDREGYWELRGKVLEASYPFPDLMLPQEIQVEIYRKSESSPLREGQHMRVRGKMIPPQHRFDRQFFLERGEVLDQQSSGEGFHIGAVRRAIMARMVRALSVGAPPGTAFENYMQSMLTGDKSFLKDPEKSQLRNAGVMHFFAVSGFHLTVVALVCFSLLTLTGLPRDHATLGMLVFCGLYVWVTGAPISARRALLMLVVFFASRLVLRKPDALAATVAAAWLLLLLDPLQLFAPGYQLSFVVVAGIISQATRLHAFLSLHGREDPWEIRGFSLPLWRRAYQALHEFFAGSFAVSWTAFWLSAPIIGCHFEIIPFASVILNTFLVPLFALTMTAGFLSAGFGIVGLFALSGFINHASWVLLSVIEAVIVLASKVPLTLTTHIHPFVATVAVVCMLAVGLVKDLRLRKNRSWFLASPLICLLSIGLSQWVFRT